MSSREQEHGTVRHATDQMQDTVSAMAGKMSAKMTADAETFVRQVAIGDLYERKAARMILGAKVSEAVHDAARKMLEDHTTSTHQLMAALEMNETRGVTPPPDQLDARREKMLEHLRAAPADKVERDYLDQQVLAHEETWTLLSSYGERGDNAQLRSFALSSAPVVARHLQRMKSLLESRST